MSRSLDPVLWIARSGFVDRSIQEWRSLDPVCRDRSIREWRSLDPVCRDRSIQDWRSLDPVCRDRSIRVSRSRSHTRVRGRHNSLCYARMRMTKIWTTRGKKGKIISAWAWRIDSHNGRFWILINIKQSSIYNHPSPTHNASSGQELLWPPDDQEHRASDE